MFMDKNAVYYNLKLSKNKDFISVVTKNNLNIYRTEDLNNIYKSFELKVTDKINCIEFTSDNQLLFSKTHKNIEEEQIHEIILWNFTCEKQDFSVLKNDYFTNDICSSNNSIFFATCDNLKKKIKIWNMKYKILLKEIDYPINYDSIIKLYITKDSNTLICFYSNYRYSQFIDLNNNEIKEVLFSYTSTVCFSPDEKYIFQTFDNFLYLCNMNAELISSSRFDNQIINSEYSECGNYIYIFSLQNMHVFCLKTLKIIKEFNICCNSYYLRDFFVLKNKLYWIFREKLNITEI